MPFTALQTKHRGLGSYLVKPTGKNPKFCLALQFKMYCGEQMAGMWLHLGWGKGVRSNFALVTKRNKTNNCTVGKSWNVAPQGQSWHTCTSYTATVHHLLERERERRRAQKWAQKQQEAHAGAATTREAQITGQDSDCGSRVSWGQ